MDHDHTPHMPLQFFVANGIRQAAFVAGDGAAGSVLLIHGLGWDHTLWRGQVTGLVADGWRVVAPDLRGMGATEKPEAQWTIDDYVADLAALADAVSPGPVVVIGFSLGGMIAAALAIAHPRRIGGLLIAAAGMHSTPEGQAGTEAMLSRAASLGPRAFATEQASAIYHPDWAAAHPEAVAHFIASRAAMNQESLRRTFRSSYGIDLRDRLPAIAVPTRVVAADSDPFVPVSALRDAARRIPDADFVLVERAGHMIPIEQPEAFTAAVDGLFRRL